MIDFIESGLRTIKMEVEAVGLLSSRVDQQFRIACETILACQGRVIVTGMGKSGHIGNKIAATLASTGTPAFFVHPGEASHGDLGMITKTDVVIAISNSGNTNEIVTLLPLIARLGIPLISMTGDEQSQLAKAACANLDVSVTIEACPLNLAPTTSTTVTLVMGDALAIALLEARGFNAEDFAFSHPSGALGRKLLLRVKDIMHEGDQIPVVSAGKTLQDALIEMTQKGLGMTTIMSDDAKLVGIFTDGDLRRIIDLKVDFATTSVSDVMSANPKTIPQNMLAAEALTIMEKASITALIVEEEDHITGVLHLHDILRAGVI
ncbi:KpsF/GutQ family sugar-phosphate isomerase [Porticoccaceae bacterium]|jgi:arabinose-5-phosphate isomerase|nr:KpsF/GutQ family sugar-phosphate isomerase [Porticoccaceae bacterium]MDA8878123.1 KpsF/GutQ family sugar-phosphate isomerase [Porticoccaceae bacterium]MDA8941791.1 KpsF/GutQ family sugar-phosphate isomerase [Porticoccaceae bacterium]MDB2400391.1 KpsF/GutQ family sugar-phosphate isomerase [Porticoccaceae bacterium]MDB2558179.1 KpsF/GutQ family sugar-phosphate isomerase [Porticoccaceae bacterium]